MKYTFTGFAINALFMLFVLSEPILAQEGYADNSLLSSGQWFRIGIRETGIYRIDYSRLKQIGLSNPSVPRIFGNNRGQLSYYAGDPSPDDLSEVAVYISKGSDNIFNEGDYILFFGEATHRWRFNSATGEYSFARHNYSDSSFYFLTSSSSAGLNIGQSQAITEPSNYQTNSSDALFIHEIETENLIKSGREWYQPISTISPLVVNPGFQDLVPGEKISFTIRVLGRSSVPVMFRMYEGSTLHQSILVPEVNIFSTTGMYARDVQTTGTITPGSASPSFELRFYNNGEQGAKGWADYLQFQARSLISFSGKTSLFSDRKSIGPGRITEFTVKSSIPGMVVWDVSEPHKPAAVAYTRTGDQNKFRTRTDSLRRFVLFSQDGVLTPVISSKPVPPQDLHGSGPADMIIVSHPLFVRYAEKLSQLHLEKDGIRTLIVTPGQIYNEFSGGVPDAVAIRNFIRMKFLRQQSTSTPLKYLLLFGDGSFENKTLPPKNPNFVPTWQSKNSTVVVSSFTSDDFYGLLEDGEGEAEGTEDIGIGRFPVADTVQASIMVSKVRSYLSGESLGNWRNTVTIVADDEDGNTHMTDAEGLGSLMKSSYPDFNIDKIYLDAFRQVTLVNGQAYPDVTKAINDRINTGTLIFDYLGHGSEVGLAHERVVKTEDINSWRNGARLPVFITATCEFSRFDDVEYNSLTGEMPGKTSAGEMVILNPDGGGIALLTTTRVVYSAPNYTLNRNILRYAFTLDSNGNALALGDIIRLAKISSGNGMNKRNFLLLGDPALKLAWAYNGRTVTDSINSEPVAGATDSLKALSLITVSGHVEDNGGNILNDFNGYVYPVVFDKARRIRTLSNDGSPVMEFDMQNSILFSGKTKAASGRFRFTFIVPKDIDYSYGKGKISYYASDDRRNMGGSFSDLIVGGFTTAPEPDNSGPDISLYLNDTLFRPGGICDEDPVLLAVIEDEGGINTTGAGIGHDITAWLDDDPNSSFILNSYYESDLDNYKKGFIRYPLAGLSTGNHSLSLKAWDNFNNSSQSRLVFVVKSGDVFIINNLLNYPNPFTDRSNIIAEHNRPDEKLQIRIDIYNQQGMIIRIIEETVESSGYRLPPIVWDGCLAGGEKAARGIYPYKVKITTEAGETAKSFGKMIIL